MRVSRNARSMLRCGAALAAVGAAAWAVRDYARWRSLGPGGLPANVRGWVKMSIFRLRAADELNVAPIQSHIGRAYDRREWIAVRRRDGFRPSVSPYPVPHRQLSQLPDLAVRSALTDLFDRKVLDHADRVHYALSHFEKRNLAITLANPAGTVGGLSHGEIAHIHPSDNSMHMILSPSDAVPAIEMGWAQRHGLAGIAVGLPVTYVMVYAPRSHDDLKVVEELLDAAIAYAVQPVVSPR